MTLVNLANTGFRVMPIGKIRLPLQLAVAVGIAAAA